jgi:phosphoglycolate phosphatase
MPLIPLTATIIAPPPSAIILDWDNTLVDTQVIIHNAKAKTTAEFAAKAVDTQHASSGSSASFFDAFVDKTAARTFFYKEYFAAIAGNLCVLPGAEELLKCLRSLAPLLIVSNKRQDILEAEIDSLGWRHYFKTILGSSGTDASKDKPNAYPAHQVLTTVNVPASPAVWFIGDADADIQCALRSGCQPILYGNQREFTGNTEGKSIPYYTSHTEFVVLLTAQKTARGR